MPAVHPLTRYIPMRADPDRVSIDVAQSGGLREPVVLYEGMIIEGRVRYQACLELGIQPSFRHWKEEGDPLVWMARRHVESHELSWLEKLAFANDLYHIYEDKPRPRETLAQATALGEHTIQKIGLLRKRNRINRVLEGKETLNDALRAVGLGHRTRGVKTGRVFGRGDRFEEVTTPLQRYLSGWKSRNFEFKHVNPKEAQRRLKVIDELLDGLQGARTDLEARSVKPRHVTR